MKKLRPIAICLIWREDQLLLGEGYDPSKKQYFYRPLGGEIEFGERSEQTIIREFREEINAEVVNIKYLGILENIFTYDGKAGHEIVLVYQGAFANPAIYQQEEILGIEDNGLEFKSLWKPISDFPNQQTPLYPDGLLHLIHSMPPFVS